MLPKDIFKYLPDPLAENIDANGQALVDYLNQFCIDTKNDILSIWYMKHTEQTKPITLDKWGDYLEAGILNEDTDRQKRQKIIDAIQGHKLRGTWLYDIKIVIDSITGKDSKLVENTTIFEEDDSIIVGDNSTENSLFSTIGTDGVNTLGTYIPEIKASVSLVPGVVAIDLGLTEDEIITIEDDDSIIVSDNSTENFYYSTIGVDGVDNELGTFIPDGAINPEITTLLEKLTNELINKVPAYEIIYLGYINDDGNFIVLTII
jgi:hypothetical protein